MRFNETKTRAFIAHKADIILQNGPLEELAGNGWNCFLRIMDIFCEEGPGDRQPISSESLMKSLIRRRSDGIRFINCGKSYTVIMRHAHLSPSRQGLRGAGGVLLTVPSLGWEYVIFSHFPGSTVRSILNIDHFLPDIISEAEKLAILAQIKLAQKAVLSLSHSDA